MTIGRLWQNTKHFKFFLAILLRAGGTVGVAALSLWWGSWFPDAQLAYSTKCEITTSCRPGESRRPDIVEITGYHFLDFKAPVPYAVTCFLLATIAVVADARNLNFERLWKQLGAEKEAVEAMLRGEKEDHAETRRLYNEAIEYILKYIFRTTTKDWWSPSCRVTIYRHTGDHHFKRIFRYAEQSQYNNGGRVKIPDREGVVGAAWLNEGFFQWSSSSSPTTNAYRDDLGKKLRSLGVSLPSDELTMPTRDFLALAVKDANDEKIAIVVVESIEPGTIGIDDVKTAIEGQNYRIAKLINDKSRLDEILNPDSN